MEEQTSANTEELEPTPNEEAVASDASDAEAEQKERTNPETEGVRGGGVDRD